MCNVWHLVRNYCAYKEVENMAKLQEKLINWKNVW